MEIPQELESIKSDLKQYETSINEARDRLRVFEAANPRFSEFGFYYLMLDSRLTEVLEKLSEVQRRFGELLTAITERTEYTKDFDLHPGDRIRIAMPAQEPFPAGWAEGVVIDAHWYSDAGWYIEFEKWSVSPGWQTGYGYWKQREDGGTVEKIW